MFNARSLRNKYSDLEALAISEALTLSESRMNTENRDFLAEYSLPNYSMFSYERQNEKGGSILFYMEASKLDSLAN